jgi:hypothetical protein
VSAPAESPLSPTLPTDLSAAHAMILAERQARIEAQAEALAAKAASSKAPRAMGCVTSMAYSSRTVFASTSVLARRTHNRSAGVFCRSTGAPKTMLTTTKLDI